jgi:hypothetical protein
MMHETTVLDRICQPAGRIVVRHIGEEHLLVPVSGTAASGHAVFPLNETALFLWERLSDGKTIRQAAEEMASVFNTDAATALLDCEGLSQTLMELGLLGENGD